MLRQPSNTAWNATSHTEHPSALSPSGPNRKPCEAGTCGLPPKLAQHKAARRQPADPRERIASLTLPETPFYGGHVVANLGADGSETEPSIS